MKYFLKYSGVYLFLIIYILSYILPCTDNFLGSTCFYYVAFNFGDFSNGLFNSLRSLLIYIFLNTPHLITLWALSSFIIFLNPEMDLSDKKTKNSDTNLPNIYLMYVLFVASIISILLWNFPDFYNLGSLQIGYYMWAYSQIFLYVLVLLNYYLFNTKKVKK